MVLFGMPERKSSISYPEKFNKLFEIPKTAKNKGNQGVQWCRICDKRNYHARNGVKCIHLKHIMHKKCSKIQNPHNFVGATCLTETFPLAQIENFELEKLSFNSNFSCSCLQKDSNIYMKTI